MTAIEPVTNKYKLPVSGHRFMQLVRELAEQGKPQRLIAEAWGVSQPSISAFAQRNAHVIKQVQDDLDNEMAGLWIAEKRARLAEYEADTDAINEHMHKKGLDDKLLGAKHRALKNAAEEMGQLPARMNVNIDNRTVEYTIIGVDPDWVK